MTKKDKTEPRFRRNKEEKINRIIDVFYELVDKHGYKDITTDDVAEKAGLSIGTVYRYFPKGKPSIIRSSFDKISEQFTKIEEFSDANLGNMGEKLKDYFTDLIIGHRKNSESHLAMDIAILTNSDMIQDYQKTTYEYFKKVSEQLREVNPFYKNKPEEQVIRELLFMFHISEALIHRHIFISPIFLQDETLADFLTKLLMEILRNPSTFF
ncbi:MAG: TetR/AcrR family transcriptional regulator [Asgard group archaeon]|nr:TetR/AcrR family transcriptional regulator [Asgard group archaeon]